MKKLSILLSLLLFPLSLIAEDIPVSSSINAVTLYQDRADVNRSTRTNLPAGRHTLKFSPVPQSVRADSLRVGGKGSAGLALLGVELKTTPVVQDTSPKVQELEIKIEEVAADISKLGKRQKRITAERELLKTVKLNAGVPGAESNPVRPRTAGEMQKVLGFIADASSKLDNEELDTERTIIRKKKELDTLNRELAGIRPGNRSIATIEVDIFAEKPGKAELEVSYQVPSAGWRPTYNLNFESAKEGEDPSFNIETYALIFQQTGEDWKDVDLTLSTARPHRGMYRPSPRPIVLDLEKPIKPLRSKRKQSAGFAAMEMEEAMPADMAFKDEDFAEPLQERTAAVKTGGVLVYEVADTVSLKADGSREKIKVASSELAGSILNVAVPSMSQDVYREAEIENTSGQALLPGKLSVFSNRNFVGAQNLPYTAPGKKINLPVGVSDELLARRDLIKKYEDDSGVVRTFRRIATEYKIELENLTQKEQKIVVLEPGVVSRNEKITTKLSKLSPAPLTSVDKNRLSKDKDIMEWHISVPPKAKKQLAFETTVEFKPDINVSGLDRL